MSATRTSDGSGAKPGIMGLMLAEDMIFETWCCLKGTIGVLNKFDMRGVLFLNLGGLFKFISISNQEADMYGRPTFGHTLLRSSACGHATRTGVETTG